MKVRVLGLFGALLLSPSLFSDKLGFVEQKFSHLNFEKGKWTRSAQLPCYVYTANESGATVDVLRIGMGNLVPFRATRGLQVTVCGSTAAFDEGFEASAPVMNTRTP